MQALQCLRHLFRAACPLDAVRAMHDALRAALRNANRAVRGDEEAITFLMGEPIVPTHPALPQLAAV